MALATGVMVVFFKAFTMRMVLLASGTKHSEKTVGLVGEPGNMVGSKRTIVGVGIGEWQ
jgi:hypothetical protein